MPASGDRIRIGTGAAGVERLEAHLSGQAFAPHRHDTYGIGLTLRGVQGFRFRGQPWHSLPGQCQILHPDELHDGWAGTDEGFGYRIVYLDPALVQQALGGRPLPFVAEPVIAAPQLPAGLAALWDLDGELDELARVDLVAAVVNLLTSVSPEAVRKTGRLPLDRLARVREFIAAAPAERPPITALERLSGLDRWTLARQFRAAFGTSPSRFRTLRQLDRLRRAVEQGAGLAEAALEAGFADQSHMSRQFKRTYGLTPARWVAALS
jgi:AraC-like DNA-binding protein